MATLLNKKVAKSALKLLNALNNWITPAVVMTVVAIFPAFRFFELSRLSYRLRDEGSIASDWARAEALAWGFGAMISITTALFLWGMVRVQMRRRGMLAAKATACNCGAGQP